MSEPLSFPSVTANFALPLLFAGQVQKEFFINQAFATIDALLQLTIEDIAAQPPSEVTDGQVFLVAASAADDWTGKDDNLALRIAGAWQFLAPTEGMKAFNRATGQFVLYNAGWKTAAEPVSPSGGSIIDVEARSAIDEIVQALRTAGVFAR